MVRYFGEMHISNFPKMKKLQIVCIFYKKHFTNEDYWYIMTISSYGVFTLHNIFTGITGKHP